MPGKFRLPPFRVERVWASLSDAETVDWGLSLTGVPDAWRVGNGAGVRVAVLDTGVDLKHQDLAPAVVAAKDFTRSPRGPNDVNGHGTHCAGIVGARANGAGVVGVAPKCDLLIGKVLGDDGTGWSDAIAAGIAWAVASGAHIISASFGASSPDDAIADAINRAADAGVAVIVAAGNEGPGPNTVGYPARMENVVAVGAVDRYGRVADYSSRGDQVDIAAPGSDVLSTWPSRQYARISGTSMATPFVAGVVALRWSTRIAAGLPPTEPIAEVLSALAATAIDAGPAGRDPDYGWGLIDPGAMVDPPSPPSTSLDGAQLRIVVDGVAYRATLAVDPEGEPCR